MDFKNKITEHKLFDYFILSIIAYYTIFITPINIILIVVTTKAYLLNNENLLNSFIMELIGFVCLTQLYLIKCYNYIVGTKEFKKLYIKAANTFPILNNYDPEMLFIKLLCSDNEDTPIIIGNSVVEEAVDAREIPIEPDTKRMKRLFMAEMIKNPALISNMTKMMGNIDPNIMKTFSAGLGNNTGK